MAALRQAPLPLVAPAVRRHVRRTLADPVALRTARHQMDFLLGAARPDADLEAAARRHVESMVWRRELRWRPGLAVRQEVTGLEHLRRQAGGGGQLLCFLHHGRYEGIFGAIRRAGGPELTTVAGDDMFTDSVPPHLQAIKATAAMGGRLVPKATGYRGLRDVVAGGGTLGIAVDLPGRSQVRFVGRRLSGASGAAQIAVDTGSPVVLALPHRVDGGVLRQRLELSEPLHPADHADATSLLQAMLDRLEPAVLAWPEAYEWPRAKFTQLDEDGRPLAYERDPGEPEH